MPTLQGRRPLLLAGQALVTETLSGGSATRSVPGFDDGRAFFVLAVVEKRAGIPLEAADVFL